MVVVAESNTGFATGGGAPGARGGGSWASAALAMAASRVKTRLITVSRARAPS